MIIIFIGPPGSGKGTQAALTANKLGFLHLSTGEVLRQKLESGDSESEKIKKTMAAGKLVSTDVVNKLVLDAISGAGKGCILDGYPRNLAQAKFLDENCKDKVEVIYFDVDRSLLIKRISGRFSCSGCGKIYNSNFGTPKVENICDKCGCHDFIHREDDTEDTVKVRLKEYDRETNPLVDHYKALGKLKVIDANGSVDEIAEELHELLR